MKPGKHSGDGAVNLRLPEGEHTSVGREKPVALAVRQGRGSHDRGVELPALWAEDFRHGAEEPSLAEGEHTSVGREKPVALAARGRCDGAGHRSGQVLPQLSEDTRHGPAEASCTERKDATIFGGQPVGVHAIHHGSIELLA
jgi:hypothetical protein